MPKISELTTTSDLSGDELVPIVKAGTTKRTTIGDINGVLGDDLAASGGSALMGFIQAGANAVSTSAQASLRATVTPEQYGAVRDGVTDDRHAFVKADTYLVSVGGGEIKCSRGTYAFGSAYAPSPNVHIVGAGMYATRLKVLGSGYRLLDSHGGAESGSGSVSDLTLWGYADTLTTAGTDADRLAVIGPFETGAFRRVRAIHSRYVSLTGSGTHFDVEGCRVEKSLRDGISLNGVVSANVRNNEISEVADDAIAIHVGAAVSGVIDKAIVVTGNRLRKCLGIKLLGARNAVVTGNNTRFVYGYGLTLGLDSGFGEGMDETFSIVVANNTFTDTIGLLPISGANGVAVISVSQARSLGTGGSAIASYPGTYNAGAFITPDDYINVAGAANPRGPVEGLLICNNVIKQTLSGLTNFSDAGYGSLWWTTGAVNPAFATNISLLGASLLKGISFVGDFDGVRVSSNYIEGVNQSVIAETFDVLRNFTVAGNTVRRCINGPTISPAALRHVGVVIENNDIDIDPYCEATGAFGRTSPLNGTWASVGGSAYMGCSVVFTIGAVIRGNRFRNCLKPIAAGGGSISDVRDNLYFWDFVNAKGIGAIHNNYDYGNQHFWVDSDPTSAAYGEHSTTADGAFVQVAAAVPTTGYFYKGQFVEFTAPTLDGDGRYLSGWRRLTTGSAHVVGTDWALAYESNATTTSTRVSVPTYTVATLPSAAGGGMIYVSDEAGGGTLAFSNTANWLRVQDRAVVS
jgi:hypothetical protein